MEGNFQHRIGAYCTGPYEIVEVEGSNAKMKNTKGVAFNRLKNRECPQLKPRSSQQVTEYETTMFIS